MLASQEVTMQLPT